MMHRAPRGMNWLLVGSAVGSIWLAACYRAAPDTIGGVAELPSVSEPASNVMFAEPLVLRDSGGSLPAALPDAPVPVVPAERPIRWNWADLQMYLESWVSDRAGTFGLVVSEVKTGTRYSVNPQEPFPSASLYKLLLLIAAFHEVEQGRLSLTETFLVRASDAGQEEPLGGLAVGDEVTLQQAISAVAQVSSNTAAWLLIRVLGPDTLLATAEKLDLPATHFCCLKGEPEVTTAEDMATLFEQLAVGAVISPWVSAQVLAELEQSQIDDRIPAELPTGTVVAHKTGNLEDVIHDAGIVYSPQGPIVVVLLSKDVAYQQTLADFSDVARRIFEAHSGSD